MHAIFYDQTVFLKDIGVGSMVIFENLRILSDKSCYNHPNYNANQDFYHWTLKVYSFFYDIGKRRVPVGEILEIKHDKAENKHLNSEFIVIKILNESFTCPGFISVSRVIDLLNGFSL